MDFIKDRQIEVSGVIARQYGFSNSCDVCAILKETEKAYQVMGYSLVDNKFKAFWTPKKMCREEKGTFEGGYREILTNCDFAEALEWVKNLINFWK